MQPVFCIRDLHWKNAVALPDIFVGKTTSMGKFAQENRRKGMRMVGKPAVVVVSEDATVKLQFALLGSISPDFMQLSPICELLT